MNICWSYKNLSTDSNEIELPKSSLSKDDSVDSQHIAEETEDMFKNGLYAHWWMKADLSLNNQDYEQDCPPLLKIT